MVALIKSIWAGIAISIGSMIYVNIGGPVGAFFFSIGLLLVFVLGLNLYTGLIGFISNLNGLLFCAIVFIGNFIGAGASLLMTPEPAAALAAAKLAMPWYIAIAKGALCGALIYAAVVSYKNNKWWITLFAVPAFILAGYEHSIADMCYFIGARMITWESLGFIGLVALGNAVGAILLHQSLLFVKKYDIIKEKGEK